MQKSSRSENQVLMSHGFSMLGNMDKVELRGCLKSPEMSVFDRWRALLKGHLHCPKSSEINDAYFHMDTSHAEAVPAETFQTASKLDFIHFGYEALSINTLSSDPVPEVFECWVKYRHSKM